MVTQATLCDMQVLIVTHCRIASLPAAYQSAALLAGPFPNITCSGSLEALNVSGNNFSGPIPETLCSCHSLISLDLSHNAFDSEIPRELFNLTNIYTLSLAGNNLTGSIRMEIGQLNLLTSLDVSDNSLEGAIPSSLGSISSLVKLSLGGNQLAGPIPKTLARFRTESFQPGNEGLCDAPLVECKRNVGRRLLRL